MQKEWKSWPKRVLLATIQQVKSTLRANVLPDMNASKVGDATMRRCWQLFHEFNVTETYLVNNWIRKKLPNTDEMHLCF